MKNATVRTNSSGSWARVKCGLFGGDVKSGHLASSLSAMSASVEAVTDLDADIPAPTAADLRPRTRPATYFIRRLREKAQSW